MKKFFTLAAAALATSAYAAIDSVPESAQVETWYLNAEVFYPSEHIINREIQVAIDGDDLYFNGLYDLLPAWVKGTLSNGVYEFATGQDCGQLWGYNFCFSGYDGDYSVLATATLADGVLTFDTGIGYLYTDYPESLPQIWFVPGATMSAEPQEYVEPVLNDQTASLPYKNNFDSEAKRSQVTNYSPDNAGWDWGADWSTNNWYAACNNDSWTQADDYLIFPGLTFEAGKAYTVHFDAVSSSSSYWQYFEVVMAPEAKLSKFTNVLLSGQCYSAEWENVEQEFTVEESGTYYLAIHSTSYPYSGYFSVDNFVVEEVDMQKPEVASYVTVTPGRNGVLSATVSFSMPAANIGGDAYASDKSLDYTVSRGDVVVAQGSGLAGSMVFASDAGEELTNGMVTYTVVVRDGSHVSKEAKATAYIGIDYPTESEYVEAIAEGNLVTIAWAPVTRGANGGYVGAKYNVYACPAKYQRGEKLNDEPLTECIFTFKYDVESGEQGEAWFCVTAVNEVDESYGAYASISVGAPYELPFIESFADDSHVWSFDGDDGSSYIDHWGSYSSDGDGSSLCFYIWGWEPDKCLSVATTGKICTAANATLSFDYKTEANAKLSMFIYNNEPVDNIISTTTELYEFDAGAEGSLSIPCIFDQVLSAPFVYVEFFVELDAAYQSLYIDNLKIEVEENTVGITELSQEGNAKVYDLSGKQHNARPATGIFIQDGQLQMVK